MKSSLHFCRCSSKNLDVGYCSAVSVICSFPILQRTNVCIAFLVYIFYNNLNMFLKRF